jgi:hypothetical protein
MADRSDFPMRVSSSARPIHGRRLLHVGELLVISSASISIVSLPVLDTKESMPSCGASEIPNFWRGSGKPQTMLIAAI